MAIRRVQLVTHIYMDRGPSQNRSFAGAEPLLAQIGRNSKPASPNKSSHQSMRREPVGKSGFETAREGHFQPSDARRRALIRTRPVSFLVAS
jgi:hypothetical protein